MMGTMEYLWVIAIIAGCIIASLRLTIGSKFDEILVIVRSLKFLKRSKFNIYYSIIDGQWSRERNPDFIPIHMIFLQEEGLIRSYEEYVTLCKKAKPEIYNIFHHYLVSAIKDATLRVFPVILLPAVFFWQQWYFYLMGVALYFTYLLITDALGWFVNLNEVINRTQDALLLAAFKKFLDAK